MQLDTLGNTVGDLRTISMDKDEKEIPEILEEFKEVFNQELSNQLPPSRACDMSIELEEDEALPRAKTYPLRKIETKLLKEYLDVNLRRGFIRRSNSKVASTTRN